MSTETTKEPEMTTTKKRQRSISQDCAGCGQSIDIRRPDALCTNCQIKRRESHVSIARCNGPQAEEEG